jgi:hypothetical protein
MTGLTKRDKQRMALGIRWQLATVKGMPGGFESAPAFLTAMAAPGAVEARRDELLTDPDFAEAYAAAATADGWRAFIAQQEGPTP